jgi:hypothetical protein
MEKRERHAPGERTSLPGSWSYSLEVFVKKLILLLVIVAIGALIAKKVRDA